MQRTAWGAGEQIADELRTSGADVLTKSKHGGDQRVRLQKTAHAHACFPAERAAAAFLLTKGPCGGVVQARLP